MSLTLYKMASFTVSHLHIYIQREKREKLHSLLNFVLSVIRTLSLTLQHTHHITSHHACKQAGLQAQLFAITWERTTITTTTTTSRGVWPYFVVNIIISMHNYARRLLCVNNATRWWCSSCERAGGRARLFFVLLCLNISRCVLYYLFVVLLLADLCELSKQINYAKFICLLLFFIYFIYL